MILSTLNYIHKALREKVDIYKQALDASRDAEEKALREGDDAYKAMVEASGHLVDLYYEAVGVLEEFEEQEW